MDRRQYIRVLVRPSSAERRGWQRLLDKGERLLEFLAKYPPYSLGCEDAGLTFDQYRGLGLGDRSRDRRY
jgi:hypothetical protein